MKSMSNKSGNCESNDGIEDRLSGLPDEVILHILSLMPTLDAVRTMLLRRFRNLWTLVPALSFDLDEYYYRMIRINHKPPSSHEMFSSFARFVRNVLMLYRRSVIDTFYLSIPIGNLEEELTDAQMIVDVDIWLRFAIGKQVKDLYFDSAAFRYGLCPPLVFTSQSLTALTLSHCTLNHFEHQSQFHMGTIRKLSLIQVCGTANAYDKLLHGCPSLQELFIEVADGPELLSLNINSPSVFKLYLQLFNCHCTLNCPSLKILDIVVYETTLFPLSMIGVISLQEVNVKNVSWGCSFDLVKSLFELIPNAKIFTLSCYAFEKISFLEKMEFPQNRWERIVLHPQWTGERCLEFILKLMKCSVNLEELIICTGESSGYCELCCPELSTFVIPLLKTVTIHGNHGYENWCKVIVGIKPENMQSMSKKSKSCESNNGIEDRLSGMPDEVILHILSLMPTLDAVRTMLLRRFQNLWAMVPSLSFDFEDYSDEMIWINGKPPSNDVAFSSFACFVRNVLMLYKRSTIDNFCLTISNLGKKANDAKIIGDVRMWLRYAIEKEVKDLDFHYCSVSFDLPRCVFTSQSLGTLMLFGCTIKHYEHQSHIHMGMLTKLSLFCAKGSTKTFNQLISGCTSLKELILSFAADPVSEILNINVPSLINLYLRHLNYPCTLNCPSLKMLDIGAYEYERSPYFQLSVVGVLSLHEVNVEYLPMRCFSGEVQPFFKLVQNAEVFTLSCKAFEEISSIEKIEFPQNRWRRIVLNLEWTGERCLEVIFELMKKSVNLEELKIYAGESSGDSQLLCSEFTACVLPLLKMVTIHGNHGYKKWCEGQLQVIEFLLTNAVVLEKLVITFGENILTTVEKFDLVKQVSTFRRASSNATVIFA